MAVAVREGARAISWPWVRSACQVAQVAYQSGCEACAGASEWHSVLVAVEREARGTCVGCVLRSQVALAG